MHKLTATEGVLRLIYVISLFIHESDRANTDVIFKQHVFIRCH